MARCEDFPCCGHEPGCCPDFDEAGNQLNMKCVCGATLPLNNRYSICDSCLNSGDGADEYDGGLAPEDRTDWQDEDPGDYPEDRMTDVEADADTLRSAGMGTDEDYGYFGQDEY